MVDLDTAFGEQFFDVAEGQAETQVPADASTITSGGKQKPAKADRGTVAGRGRQGLMTTVCLLKARSQQMQQCPSTLPTRRLGHSSQSGTANYLDLLSS